MLEPVLLKERPLQGVAHTMIYLENQTPCLQFFTGKPHLGED